MPTRVRLQDIAARTGVSVATVSRVVNGKPGVADATRRAVLDEVELQGYDRPPRLEPARSRGVIGLIVPELDNPVFSLFAHEIQRALVARGHLPVLCSIGPVHQEHDYLDMLVDRGVTGIVLVCGRHANTEIDLSRYAELQQSGVSLVFVNGYFEGIEAPFFATDDAEAYRVVVEHLHGLGHRRIGCAMGPARYVTSQRKVAGFLSAVHAVPTRRLDSDTIDEQVAHSVYSVEGGRAAAEVLLDRGVTALVCGSDLMALGAVRAARSRGLTVPHDASVIGYDDSPLIGFTDPPLSTVRQDIAGMSHSAVEALIDEVDGLPQTRRELLFQSTLVLRRSTSPPPERHREQRDARDRPAVGS